MTTSQVSECECDASIGGRLGLCVDHVYASEACVRGIGPYTQVFHAERPRPNQYKRLSIPRCWVSAGFGEKEGGFAGKVYQREPPTKSAGSQDPA